MKKLALALVAMYLLGIGPCDVLAFLRPAPKPRPRIIDIIRHREEPQPEPPTPKPTAAIHGTGRNQYILRNGLKHYWNGKYGADARWVASWRSCSRNGCSTGSSSIKPGE